MDPIHVDGQLQPGPDSFVGKPVYKHDAGLAIYSTTSTDAYLDWLHEQEQPDTPSAHGRPRIMVAVHCAPPSKNARRNPLWWLDAPNPAL